MDKILAWAVQMIIGQVLTPENLKLVGAEVVVLLKAVVEKTPTVLDDEIVKALAEALGVAY